jgi:hypothetical protein
VVTELTALCQSSPGAVQQFSGRFDPAGTEDAYTINVVVENNLSPSTLRTASAPDGGQLGKESNDLVTLGFDVCWDLEDSIQDASAVPLLDCDEVPAGARTFVPVGGTLPVGGTASFIFEVLNVANLRAVLGATFDPTNIPQVGTIEIDDVPVGHSFAADVDTESEAWGSVLRERGGKVRMLVQARGRFKTIDGQGLYSNWMHFPLEICPHCARAECGELRLVRCADSCAAGTSCAGTSDCRLGDSNFPGLVDCTAACAGGEEESNERCTPYGFAGTLLDEDACLPFSYQAVQCVAFNECSSEEG